MSRNYRKEKAGFGKILLVTGLVAYKLLTSPIAAGAEEPWYNNFLSNITEKVSTYFTEPKEDAPQEVPKNQEINTSRPQETKTSEEASNNFYKSFLSGAKKVAKVLGIKNEKANFRLRIEKTNPTEEFDLGFGDYGLRLKEEEGENKYGLEIPIGLTIGGIVDIVDGAFNVYGTKQNENKYGIGADFDIKINNLGKLVLLNLRAENYKSGNDEEQILGFSTGMDLGEKEYTIGVSLKNERNKNGGEKIFYHGKIFTNRYGVGLLVDNKDGKYLNFAFRNPGFEFSGSGSNEGDFDAKLTLGAEPLSEQNFSENFKELHYREVSAVENVMGYKPKKLYERTRKRKKPAIKIRYIRKNGADDIEIGGVVYPLKILGIKTGVNLIDNLWVNPEFNGGDMKSYFGTGISKGNINIDLLTKNGKPYFSASTDIDF